MSWSCHQLDNHRLLLIVRNPKLVLHCQLNIIKFKEEVGLAENHNLALDQ